MALKTPSVVAVDWGTSQLRIWPLDKHGSSIDCYRSAEGMRAIDKADFGTVLDKHLTAFKIDSTTPVIMCGMVGSRQGWQEAPYNKIPCKIEDIVQNAVRIVGENRDIRILPGIANFSESLPDVMRSEETQLLGLYSQMRGELSGLVCMPGSHAKWVRFEKGIVIDFATSMSGELYAALCSNSVLKHTVEKSSMVDAKSDVFLSAVNSSLKEPATFLNRLFSARPNSLLHNIDQEAASHISGTIIGQDIAGAIARFAPLHSVTLVGGGKLGPLYEAALEIAGLVSTQVDGEETAIDGLAHAAKIIWPERFGPSEYNNRVIK